MKGTIIFLLAVFLLSGCQAQQTAQLPESSAPAVITVPQPAAETAVTVPVATAPPQTQAPVVFLPVPEPEDHELVALSVWLPEVRQELRYATRNNFTGQVIYTFQEGYLRYGTVRKLQAVCQELAEQGLSLLVWDAFRPVQAQFDLWNVCPDPTYVSDPTKGHSSHSRGNTLDVTLVDANGVPVEMPTDFDDFSALADRNYSDCSQTAAANAQLLEQVMTRNGFTGYSQEWWHFTDNDTYPVESEFIPQDVVG